MKKPDHKAERPTSQKVDPSYLLEQLGTFRIELEMQNEELRNAEQVHARLASRYRRLFEFAPTAYFVLEPGGVVAEVNIAGAQLLREDRAKLKGGLFGFFVHPRERSAFNAFLARTLGDDAEANRLEQFEVGLWRQNAQFERIAVNLRSIRLPGPEVAALVSAEDLTPRERLATAMHDGEIRQRDEIRRRDDFIGLLSHELRNPLAALQTSALLLARDNLDAEQRERAEAVIFRQCGHLRRIVDDLLDVTRIGRGKIHVELEPLNVTALVNAAVEDRRGEFAAKGVQLINEVHCDPCWSRGDETRLSQVLGNLLTNALKFTPAGGKVRVSLDGTGDWVQLSVADDGIGIDPDKQEALFEPFSQLPQSIDRSQGGLGLGLAMVKGLVSLHGGRVELASDGLGHGTVVRVFLPRLAKPAQPDERAAPPEHNRHRVLVIEDNRDAAEAMRDLLTAIGHDAVSAPDGPAGLRLATTFQPDTVLCDIGLPGMDGYGVARALRGRSDLNHPTLVALTGYALGDDIKRAMDAGFDKHVAKPVTLDQLEQILA